MNELEFVPEHIGLAATDAVRLKEWYLNVLGASVVAELSPEPPAYLLKLPGDFLVEIYSARRIVGEMSDNTVAGWRHVALKVPSIEGAREALRGRGVNFTESEKPAGGGGKVLFFRDPEGNLFHLVERLPGGIRS